MWIAYLDESYHTSKFWLGALLCDSEDVQSITAGLDEAIGYAHEKFNVPVTAELHGHRLFHGTEAWRGLHPRQRIAVYDRAMSAIGESDAQIFLRGVDIARLRRRYHDPFPPHSIALQHTLERIDEFAQTEDAYLLAVADEVPEGREHQHDLWQYQRDKTDGYRSRQLTRVLDTIYFGPSDASRLLQAIDLVVFLHHRIDSGIDLDPRAIRANQLLWSRIHANVAHKMCWTP